jgi:hypothetical protein
MGNGQQPMGNNQQAIGSRKWARITGQWAIKNQNPTSILIVIVFPCLLFNALNCLGLY